VDVRLEKKKSKSYLHVISSHNCMYEGENKTLPQIRRHK